METKELLKDYIAILCEDAERTYEEDCFGKGIETEWPSGYDVPPEIVVNAWNAVVKFHAAFPESTAEGGEIYLERTYADGTLPKIERDWIGDNIEPLKGTPTIWKNDDGKFEMEVE